jgi:hypothetical protein
MKRVYLPRNGPVCPTCNQPRKILKATYSRANFPDERLKYALCPKCETYLLLSDNPTMEKDVLDSIGKTHANIFSDRVQEGMQEVFRRPETQQFERNQPMNSQIKIKIGTNSNMNPQTPCALCGRALRETDLSFPEDRRRTYYCGAPGGPSGYDYMLEDRRLVCLFCVEKHAPALLSLWDAAYLYLSEPDRWEREPQPDFVIMDPKEKAETQLFFGALMPAVEQGLQDAGYTLLNPKTPPAQLDN